MKFSTLYKVFDAAVSFLDTKTDDAREQRAPSVSETPVPSFADQVETRLTNVVIAALKEAFDRDHARLELERAHLDEQRRRAEESMRLELRRQTIDRELGRLRLLAGAALVGWIVSLTVLVTRSGQIAGSSQAVLIAACALLLASVGSAFNAHANVGARVRENDGPLTTASGTASLWLLLAGLALAAVSLLF